MKHLITIQLDSFKRKIMEHNMTEIPSILCRMQRINKKNTLAIHLSISVMVYGFQHSVCVAM